MGAPCGTISTLLRSDKEVNDVAAYVASLSAPCSSINRQNKYYSRRSNLYTLPSMSWTFSWWKRVDAMHQDLQVNMIGTLYVRLRTSEREFVAHMPKMPLASKWQQ